MLQAVSCTFTTKSDLCVVAMRFGSATAALAKRTGLWVSTDVRGFVLSSGEHITVREDWYKNVERIG
jgi:hypothetical protein